MTKLNLIYVIIITIVVNALFVYVSYLTYNEFRLSILHIFFGLLPIVLFIKKSNPKKSKDAYTN